MPPVPPPCPAPGAPCPYAVALDAMHADQRRVIVALCGDLEGRQPGALNLLREQGVKLDKLALALETLAVHNARQSELVAKLRADYEARQSVRAHLYRWAGTLVAAVVLAAVWTGLPRILAYVADAVRAAPPPSP